MGIGTSQGAYYDDAFHQAAAQWDPSQDDNVVSPNMDQMKDSSIEQSPQTVQDKKTFSSSTIPVADKYDTPLTPEEQAAYSKKFSSEDSQDYDMQGFFKANPDVNPHTDGTHYPDTFKKPNHMTFSDESIYNGQNGNQGGHWGVDANGNDTFTPGVTNLALHTPQELQEYFAKVEPNVKLIMPDTAAGMGAQASQLAQDALKRTSGTKLSNSSDPFGTIYTNNPRIQFNPEDIDNGINLTMSFGAGTIAGSGSKTADTMARMKAAVLEAKGTPPEDIIKQTGWWRGPDGRMRYEIPDTGMKLADRDWTYGETGRLPDFIEHPELYKAYPHLNDINFKVADKGFPYLGGFNPVTNELTINPDKIKGGDQGILDVVSHELQHAVQNLEGFDKGSNPDKALDDALLSLKGKMREAAVAKDDTQLQGLLKLYSDIQNNALKFGEYMYQRSPGEVEANTVMSRRQLPDDLRKNVSPLESQKILEGSENSLTGGKYYPEFRYPKGTFSSDISASAPVTQFRRAANDNLTGQERAKAFIAKLPKYNTDNEPSILERLKKAEEEQNKPE